MSQVLSTQPFELQPGGAPIVRELHADLETPISIYLKLRGVGPSFLLESVTGGEQVARYSFIGVQPRRAFVFRGAQVEIRSYSYDARQWQSVQKPVGADPFEVLRAALRPHLSTRQPGLPRLTGGLVGYLGYEMARYFEPAIGLVNNAELPEAIFLQMDTIVAFDHAYGKILLVSTPEPSAAALAPERLNARLDALERRLQTALPERPSPIRRGPPDGSRLPAHASRRDAPTGLPVLKSNLTRAEYMQKALAAKEHIAAGDIFQLVLSQRFEHETAAPAFDIYRALRRSNPSPYMFFFDFDDLAGPEPVHILGASPEMHARLEGRMASVRPIAGTRKRGKTTAEDAALEAELLADPKERAEHVMLVDLGRNDLGRICEYGSVRAPAPMQVERYSHVMHIVSQVEGRLRAGLDAFDLLRATFPAGTVSGAPKIRAMQLIQALEPANRNIYAGLVGYFSYDGAMDTCIAIRTLVMRGRKVFIQAGAGIVADSKPENEYEETVSKAQALAAAVAAAGYAPVEQKGR